MGTGNSADRTLFHPLITEWHLQHDVIVYVRQSSEHQVENNKGSTAFQRSQVEIALAYGWRNEQVILIDDDLGRSGTAVDHRPGYKRMLSLVEKGQVKSVIAADISRLSRNLADFIQLLSLAGRQSALFIIDHKPINPNDHGDAFVSRILGLVAEHDNNMRTRTMMTARLAKAKKGEIVVPLPVGLVKLSDGTIIKNPEVKHVFDVVIASFWDARSLLGTVRLLKQKSIQLPSRRAGGKIVWRDPTPLGVRGILLNPAYAGIFAYGRSEIDYAPPKKNVDEEEGKLKRLRRKAISEDRWIKFEGKFPAYLTSEQQKEIRQILKKNAFPEKHHTRQGSALLQGLLVCAKCGQKLRVSY